MKIKKDNATQAMLEAGSFGKAFKDGNIQAMEDFKAAILKDDEDNTFKKMVDTLFWKAIQDPTSKKESMAWLISNNADLKLAAPRPYNPDEARRVLHAPINVLFFAVESNCRGCIEAWMESEHFDPNFKNEDGVVLFGKIIEKGWDDLAEKFLDRGFDINGKYSLDHSTVLHGLAAEGLAMQVAWMLERGADPGIRNLMRRYPEEQVPEYSDEQLAGFRQSHVKATMTSPNRAALFVDPQDLMNLLFDTLGDIRLLKANGGGNPTETREKIEALKISSVKFNRYSKSPVLSSYESLVPEPEEAKENAAIKFSSMRGSGP